MSYGAVELEDGRTADAAQSVAGKPWRWVGLAGALAVGLVAAGLATENAHLKSANASLAAQLEAAALTPLTPAATSESASISLGAALPTKRAVPYVTPRVPQMERGTCWDFASIGALEQTYREYGVRMGWMDTDEYVAFSEQAYGVQVLEMCAGSPDSQQQAICRVPGDEIYTGKSTEGGEAPILYYFMNELENAILPDAVCPYFPDPGTTDAECDGRKDALAHNPLRFTAMDFGTLYDVDSIKRRLATHDQAMTLSTGMALITHFYPCLGELAEREECQPSSPQCVPCPDELRLTPCCVPLPGTQNYNMDGEFIAHQDMYLEGGHAMLLVGYNDNFRTRNGDMGGLIVKNSWLDGTNPPKAPKKARGSHSMAYWMQEVSDWDERVICPNSHSPYSWYTCGNDMTDTEFVATVPGSSAASAAASAASASTSPAEEAWTGELSGLETCTSAETAMFAEANYQPLHLRCSDPAQCTVDDKVVYYAKNMTNWGDRMARLCAFELPLEHPEDARVLCLKPMLVAQIAYVFEPVPEEMRENDADYCGFYFFPYDVINRYVVAFRGFFVNWFEIQWSPESYLANRRVFDNMELDYSLVEKSTHKQSPLSFSGPFPRAQVVMPHRH